MCGRSMVANECGLYGNVEANGVIAFDWIGNTDLFARFGWVLNAGSIANIKCNIKLRGRWRIAIHVNGNVNNSNNGNARREQDTGEAHGARA